MRNLVVPVYCSTVQIGLTLLSLLAGNCTATADPWQPAALENLVVWYDASDSGTITHSNGFVTAWSDKSGHACHVSQDVDDHQPQTGTRSVNGLNVIDFAGDYLSCADDVLPGNPDLTIAALIEVDSNGVTDDRYVQFGVGGGGQVVATSVGSGGYSWRFNNGNEVYGAVTPGQQLLVGVRPAGGDNASSQLFRNGNELSRTAGAGDGNVPSIAAGVLIGRGASNASTIWGGFDGAIAEVVVVEDASVTTRQQVEGYLAWKWGLEGDLPGSHPYKDARPEVLVGTLLLVR